MASSTIDNDVAAYAAAVRAELTDLPPPDREALVEDLEDHLAEVAAESGVPLATRLGSPQEYAAELRFAYGAGRQQRDAPWGRLTGWLARLTSWEAYRAVRIFLPELRPAWWVLRAYLAVLVVFMILSGSGRAGPVPNPFSSRGLLQIIVTAAAVVLSVRLGRRAGSSSQAMRRLALASNVLIALAGFIALSSMGNEGSPTVMYAQPYYGAGTAGPGPTNIYPYSVDGRPLDGVLLYDQDGRPLVIGGKTVGRISRYPSAADGKAIFNEYPRRETYPDGTQVAPPRVQLPAVIPTAVPAPAATPNPSPSPTP
jgi:uncharacterized membrane protein